MIKKPGKQETKEVARVASPRFPHPWCLVPGLVVSFLRPPPVPSCREKPGEDEPPRSQKKKKKRKGKKGRWGKGASKPRPCQIIDKPLFLRAAVRRRIGWLGAFPARRPRFGEVGYISCFSSIGQHAHPMSVDFGPTSEARKK